MLHTSLSLDYVLRPSNLKENAPLLIMLHGYGSDENDLFSFANELPEELLIVSVRAPYKMQPFGNAWYAINFDAEKGKWSDNEQAKQSVELIAKFIDEVANAYNINKDSITLLGFSQGSILSYAVALTYPEKVKNIIALSGYINQDILPKNLNEHDYSNLDFYCSHGNADQVIPPDWARQTQPFLNGLHIKNTYSEFPVGHGVAPQNFYEFREWLKERI
ncbi:alpha/beta hydrolase [Jejuia pallidilutea]|jgi:phospholipase/carboxylesterase|uniref:Serine esterase n=1 Tax=Jejuia pallidilutea TaxID=504487 RepID=A0A090VLZ8_9FLAO|nr:alpha/beta fold hydrolase [Jejuia pallidilutea]GAL65751.1 serine esterase [Jejuia pallidilutea]GAL72850.1 serine esterase [Jejuia pallidilutea]GAL88588.1 serine esterase [Jejuia pallidilutea]